VTHMEIDELKEILHENRLLASELSLLVGLSPGAVLHWVRGTRKIPLWFVKLTRYLDKKGITFKEYGSL
jgi:hypothetical protein